MPAGDTACHFTFAVLPPVGPAPVIVKLGAGALAVGGAIEPRLALAVQSTLSTERRRPSSSASC